MQQHQNPYPKLALMALLSFVAMYILMYAMVNAFSEVYNNVNQAYMAAVMAAPMVPIELWLMKSVYKDRRMNMLFLAGSVVLGVLAFTGIRQQTAVGNRQFLRSMIPHHSGAILMCAESPISDPRIQDLCRRIIESQRQEIAEMESLLADPALR